MMLEFLYVPPVEQHSMRLLLVLLIAIISHSHLGNWELFMLTETIGMALYRIHIVLAVELHFKINSNIEVTATPSIKITLLK